MKTTNYVQEISEELELEFDEKEIELLQRLAGEDGLVKIDFEYMMIMIVMIL